MKPFFDTPEKIAQLQYHGAQWLGTPFMPHAAIRGAGACCQRLVGALYKECGALPAGFEIPTGPMNWSHAQTRSLIAEFVDAQPNFRRKDPADRCVGPFIQPGDMLGFKIGGCLHHCGICLAADGTFIHCIRGPGVIMSNVNDATYLSRLERVWQPLQA